MVTTMMKKQRIVVMMITRPTVRSRIVSPAHFKNKPVSMFEMLLDIDPLRGYSVAQMNFMTKTPGLNFGT